MVMVCVTRLPFFRNESAQNRGLSRSLFRSRYAPVLALLQRSKSGPLSLRFVFVAPLLYYATRHEDVWATVVTAQHTVGVVRSLGK